MSIPIPPGAIAGLCLPFGILALGWLALALRGQRRFMHRAHRASGVVQGLKSQAYGQSTLYFPIVHFTTDGGLTITAESKTGRNQSAYRVGQAVQVLYDPDQPKEMRIDSFASRWIGVIIPAFFAVLAFGIGLVALFATTSR